MALVRNAMTSAPRQLCWPDIRLTFRGASARKAPGSRRRASWVVYARAKVGRAALSPRAARRASNSASEKTKPCLGIFCRRAVIDRRTCRPRAQLRHVEQSLFSSPRPYARRSPRPGLAPPLPHRQRRCPPVDPQRAAMGACSSAPAGELLARVSMATSGPLSPLARPPLRQRSLFVPGSRAGGSPKFPPPPRAAQLWMPRLPRPLPSSGQLAGSKEWPCLRSTPL